jgi:hypothetical protein
MVSPKELYCKSTYNTNKNNEKIKNEMNKKTDEVKQTMKKFMAVADTELNKDISNTSNKFMDFIYGLQFSWRNRYGKKVSNRPDLIFIYDLILVFVLAYVLHQILFRIVPLILPVFKTPTVLKELLNISSDKISLKRIEKERVKNHSIAEHDKFFRLRPFAPITQSDQTSLQTAQMMMTIMIMIFIFLGIPFIIAYVIWFAVKYSKFFWRTGKGLFKTMFRFFFRLIKAAASRRWVIRTIMGWPKLPYPDLASEHLIPWKRSYIDPWIDREFIYYEILFRKIREKYYYQPKRRYVEIPYAKLKLFLKQLKREYIDLTYREFWLLIMETYPKFVALPENELYLKNFGADAYIKKYQNEVKEKIDENRRNVSSTAGKCLGTSYESVSKVSGKSCKCPSGQPHSCGIVSDVSSNVKDINEEITKDFDCKEEHAKLTSGFDNPIQETVPEEEVKSGEKQKIYKMVVMIVGIIIKIILGITLTISLLIIGFKIFGVPDKVRKFVVPEFKPESGIHEKTFLSELLGLY